MAKYIVRIMAVRESKFIILKNDDIFDCLVTFATSCSGLMVSHQAEFHPAITACQAGQCSVNGDIVFLWERVNFDQL
jgi:hypothetical protein